MSKKLIVGLMIGLLASPAWSAGIAFNEHAASATGVGGAVVSTVDDASAVYYNPAAVARLKGTQFYLGTTIVMPQLSYTQDFFGDTITTDSNELVAPVPSAFATYQVDDEYVVGVGSIFLGVSPPLGQKDLKQTFFGNKHFVLQPSLQ